METELRYLLSVPTGTPTTLIPCRTTVSPVLSIALCCSSVRCSKPTSSDNTFCYFLPLNEMPSTRGRSCSHSVNFPISSISRESSGGRMTVMLIKEPALEIAPGTGGLALISFKLFRELAL